MSIKNTVATLNRPITSFQQGDPLKKTDAKQTTQTTSKEPIAEGNLDSYDTSLPAVSPLLTFEQPTRLLTQYLVSKPEVMDLKLNQNIREHPAELISISYQNDNVLPQLAASIPLVQRDLRSAYTGDPLYADDDGFTSSLAAEYIRTSSKDDRQLNVRFNADMLTQRYYHDVPAHIVQALFDFDGSDVGFKSAVKAGEVQGVTYDEIEDLRERVGGDRIDRLSLEVNLLKKLPNSNFVFSRGAGLDVLGDFGLSGLQQWWHDLTDSGRDLDDKASGMFDSGLQTNYVQKQALFRPFLKAGMVVLPDNHISKYIDVQAEGHIKVPLGKGEFMAQLRGDVLLKPLPQVTLKGGFHVQAQAYIGNDINFLTQEDWSAISGGAHARLDVGTKKHQLVFFELNIDHLIGDGRLGEATTMTIGLTVPLSRKTVRRWGVSDWTRR